MLIERKSATTLKTIEENNMNGKWTKENFEIHDKAHPEIYKNFCKYALQAAAVKARYSAKCIFHRVRWDSMFMDTMSEFKVDDGWISHYARKFMEENPNLKNFFGTRVRRSTYHSEV